MSVLNTELSLKVKRVMLMIFSIDLVYSVKRNTFILKCFLQFTCTSLDGSQKEESNFLNLLQKERGVPRKGGFLRKGGIPTLPKETMCLVCGCCCLIVRSSILLVRTKMFPKKKFSVAFAISLETAMKGFLLHTFSHFD